jgi:hypothetical protein
MKRDGGLRLCVDYQALNKAQEYLSPNLNQVGRRPQNRGPDTESCRSGRRMQQLLYYDTMTPSGGDKLLAEQRRSKRGMTLPEMPE